MEEEDMEKEEKLNKIFYRIELYLIKTIPIVIALIALLNTILSYFYIEVPLLSYIGGVSLFELMFLYLSSYVFKFCVYHRLPIHYITINWLLNIYDYYIGIPLNNKNLFLTYMIISGITILLILYFKFKKK